MKAVELDPANKKHMLSILDQTRELVESGEILSLQVIAVKRGSCMHCRSSIYAGQYLPMIGALHVQANDMEMAMNRHVLRDLAWSED